MHKSLSVVVGAIFGVVLVATCGGKMGGATDAGAQSGPARVLTADTDVSQLVSGVLKAQNGATTGLYVYDKVTDGPFVLTDAASTVAGIASTLYALPAGQDCAQSDITNVYGLDGTNGRFIADTTQPIHGARLSLNAGEELCVARGASGMVPSFSWSGFRPY